MSRLGAFAAHLGISLVIFVVLMVLLTQVWYPDFFFTTDGGWEGVRLIFFVDMVIGPLLTLIVFRPGKPGLRFDLTVIALIQVACLAGGTWIVWSERPLALVYSDHRFFSLSADDYAVAGHRRADLAHLPGPWPKRAAVDLPNDDPEAMATRAALFQARHPVFTHVPAYVPLDGRLAEIVANGGIPVAAVRELDETGAVDAFVAAHGGSADDYVWVPFSTRFNYWFLGLRREPAAIAGLLEVRAPMDLAQFALRDQGVGRSASQGDPTPAPAPAAPAPAPDPAADPSTPPGG